MQSILNSKGTGAAGWSCCFSARVPGLIATLVVCVEFAHSTCGCVGFLWEPHFPPHPKGIWVYRLIGLCKIAPWEWMQEWDSKEQVLIDD